MANLIAVAGYGMQFLRAFPWFREWMTFLVVFGLAITSAMIFGPTPYANTAALVDQVTGDFLKIMGGLGISMIVSHSGIAPKYNQFGTGEQKS